MCARSNMRYDDRAGGLHMGTLKVNCNVCLLLVRSHALSTLYMRIKNLYASSQIIIKMENIYLTLRRQRQRTK